MVGKGVQQDTISIPAYGVVYTIGCMVTLHEVHAF